LQRLLLLPLQTQAPQLLLLLPKLKVEADAVPAVAAAAAGPVLLMSCCYVQSCALWAAAVKGETS
jgi:hypothetical protein